MCVSRSGSAARSVLYDDRSPAPFIDLIACRLTPYLRNGLDSGSFSVSLSHRTFRSEKREKSSTKGCEKEEQDAGRTNRLVTGGIPLGSRGFSDVHGARKRSLTLQYKECEISVE